MEPTGNERNTFLGKVYLEGSGPGDPGLMTLKGRGLLECADEVIYDALVSPEILIMINPQSEKINVGNWQGRHSLIQSLHLTVKSALVADLPPSPQPLTSHTPSIFCPWQGS